MPNKKISKLLAWVIWIAATLVELAVSWGVIQGTLTLPIIPATWMTFIGWIMLIATIWAAIGKIVKELM